MGRKCGVEGCLSDSNRKEDAGVTFHKVPTQADLRMKWLELCRIPEEKKAIKVVYVCSRHFLRANFCNFKGKKYMLRQGVLPSVFPWDKSKITAIKSQKKLLEKKLEPSNENKKTTQNESTPTKELTDKIDLGSSTSTRNDDKIENDNIPTTGSIDFALNTKINALDFNNKWNSATIVEVDEEENEILIHFENNANEEWICMDSPRLRPYTSEVLDDDLTKEYDTEDNNFNVDFSSTTENMDEIIERSTKTKDTKSGELAVVTFAVGERCFAYWNDRKKFLATVTKVMENDTYEVLFDDGYVKCIKSDRMVKTTKHIQSAPLFDPVKGTKEERREKKRKLNVAQLFGIGKRQKSENSQSSFSKIVKSTNQQTEQTNKTIETENWTTDNSVPQQEVLDKNGKWLPRWIDGYPVGIESQLEIQDIIKKSVIVPDPRIPEGWAKHLIRKPHHQGNNKWETIIVSPDGKRFRSKSDIKHYLEITKMIPYDENLFDFSIYRQRNKKSSLNVDTKKQTTLQEKVETDIKVENVENEPNAKEYQNQDDEVNLLKIPIVDDVYKCPIDGCDKNFRRENLAQMHVKHYHPEYSKFLDTTPNVADLAYARTVGDSLDKSPITNKFVKPKSQNVLPKSQQLQSSDVQMESDSISQQQQQQQQQQQLILSSKSKDTEIIKLLTSKSYDIKSEETTIQSSPSIKSKDAIPETDDNVEKKDDINEKTLNITKTPVGIKTLLPVRKAENKNEQISNQQDISVVQRPKSSKTGNKRRKTFQYDQLESFKKEARDEVQSPVSSSPPPPPMKAPAETALTTPEISSNVIMEGGELIKIVRMKQEEIINCTCGFMEEDGLMIQCELCLCWQHAYCNNIQKESEVPEKYVCYICQHPLKQKNSRKYYNDQDWLKQGVLPVGSYHTKDDEALQKRFEKLQKSHDISGGLVELENFFSTLKVKLKIAEAKNHPKLYLWSKPWEKHPLPEKEEEKNGEGEGQIKLENVDGKYENDDEENQLSKELKNLIENNQPQVPIIPQPEAAIETADCRLNLLDHILHSQELVSERLDDFEKQLDELEENCSLLENDAKHPRTRQTLEMLMRDLNKLEEFSNNTSI